MKKLIISLGLFILPLILLLPGPLASTVSAAGNSVKVHLDWVNECDISGTITSTTSSGTKTTNINLDDIQHGCIQDWFQNQTPVTVEYDDSTTCQASNLFADPYKPGSASIRGDLYYQTAGVSSGCVDYKVNPSSVVSIGNKGNANIVYAKNGNTISRVDNNSYYTFAKSSSNPNLYVMNTGACSDRILLNGSGSGALWELSEPANNSASFNASNQAPPANIEAPGCVVSYSDDDINGPTASGQATSETCSMNSTYNSASYCSYHPQNSDGSFNVHIGGSSNQTPGGSPGSVNPNNSATCESEGLGDTMAWILCGVYNDTARATNWVLRHLVQPLLVTSPLSTKTKDPRFQIWSAVRIYGNIILVIALLVVVFGEALGGGVIEAYNARKMLPRILAAAILINLSYYLVAAVVDITNIIGSGIASLITAPLKNAGAFTFHLSGGQQGTVLGITSVGPIAAILSGVFGAGLLTTLTAALPAVLLFIIMPAAFGVLAAFVTIVIRQALIIFLVFISPIAFALYCLPNTEQYYKKWWDLLVKTLAVYPIIMAIFAVADVASYVFTSSLGGFSGDIGSIIGFVALFAPLAAIPYSFKLAGGALGRAHEVLSGLHHKAQEGIKGNPNDPFSLRNRTKRRLSATVTQGQQRVWDRGKGTTDQNGNFVSAPLYRQARGKIAATLGGNIEGRMSRYNKEQAELAESMSSTGRDGLRYAGAGYVIDAGKPDFKGITASHKRYFNAKGDEISSLEYTKGKQLFGGSLSAVGAQLEYATRKAQTPEALANMRYAFAQNAMANDWNANEMGDVWAQATYPHKDKWLTEWFSTPVPTNGNSAKGGVTFQDVSTSTKSLDKAVNEQHAARESFRVSSLRAQDWQAQNDSMVDIQTRLLNGGQVSDTEKNRLAKILENLDTMARTPGLLTRTDSDEVMVQGASAQTSGVISAMYKNAKLATAPLELQHAPGTYSTDERVLYDKDKMTQALAAQAAAQQGQPNPKLDRDLAIKAATVAQARTVNSREDIVNRQVINP